MSLSLLFPHSEPGQALRVRRYLIASGTSLMFVVLLGLCVLEGVLAVRPFAFATAAVLVSIAVFYALFRTELNRKAKDPSLTVPMMLCAIGVVTYALYHVGPARPVFLLMYPVILFFGVFRLNRTALLFATAIIEVGYAIVISMLLQSSPGLDRPHIEILQWVVLTAVLMWFSFMGGYIYDLRRRLKQSEYDELTRIYTRRRVLELLAREKAACDRSGSALSICMMDIDLFKHVNDTLGHYAGDIVLQTFVNAAQRELRSIDILGRHGGEEFLLVLPQTALDGARECAERIRRQTELARAPGAGRGRRITVSIGVAEYQIGERILHTLQRADAALYRAKAAGRNRVECGVAP
jgi:diguanylate cyclase (GGDEF)-like protein